MGEIMAALPGLARSCTFAGRAECVREARQFVGGVVRDCPAADDAVLCLSELAANAVAHSDSGKPGGKFTVSVVGAGGDRVRVEVEDDGGRWDCSLRDSGQHGRGLLIVCRLAGELGCYRRRRRSTASSGSSWPSPAPPCPSYPARRGQVSGADVRAGRFLNH